MRQQFQLTSSALACAIWLLTVSPSIHAQDATASLTKPYVTVNGQAQSNGLAEILLREQFARGASDSMELRQAVREALINQALMAQEARKAKLDANTRFSWRKLNWRSKIFWPKLGNSKS